MRVTEKIYYLEGKSHYERSVVRAIGLKNINVLQPTNVEILSANTRS